MKAAAILALIWPWMTALAPAQFSSHPMELDSISADVSWARIALAPDGRVGCAWVSRDNGEKRVLFREKVGENWGPPRAFGGNSNSAPASPVLVYDEASNPHLIWRDGPKRRGEIVYAYRHSGIWLRYGALSAESGADVADPSAAFDSTGALHVAWREGGGSFWRIIAATIGAGGSLKRQDLSGDDGEGQNLYPTIVGVDPVQALWFAESESQFGLETRAFDAAAGQWVKSGDLELDELPAHRLPYLFGDGAGLVCGVWYEVAENAERVMFGLSGLTQGAGAEIDGNPGVSNRQPHGALAPNGPVVCWRADTMGGPAIFVRRGLDGEWLRPAILSLPDPPYPARPQVAADAHDAHVVWISESEDGGTGNLYYSRVGWNETAAR